MSLENKTSPLWFILEVETGKIDGWYTKGPSGLSEIKDYWDNKRPQFRHMICQTMPDNIWLYDNLCLNRQPDVGYLKHVNPITNNPITAI